MYRYILIFSVKSKMKTAHGNATLYLEKMISKDINRCKQFINLNKC